MRILLTGATGYIGQRLLPLLLEEGHEVICCARDTDRLNLPGNTNGRAIPLEIDFLEEPDLDRIPLDFDVAYYLIHSMASNSKKFEEREITCAKNFRTFASASSAKQVIYLGGIVAEKELSPHLQSRKQVGNELREGSYSVTEVQAGIIVGSGSASFEIIRDLVEKLPVMITPQWVLTRSQPVSVKDVVECLEKLAGQAQYYDRILKIGGPEIMTYREMLLRFAKKRGLKRYILSIPILSPKLSSYWLYFVTSTAFHLAVHLVDSMKVEVIAEDNALPEILGREPISYEEAVHRAFRRIRQNAILSSWTDSFAGGKIPGEIPHLIQVPEYGCFRDIKELPIEEENVEQIMENIWSIGGKRGWYYGTWLWKLRGYLDKLAGGIGLRRGRRHPTELRAGDSLDFWRVLLPSRPKKRLLLYAEMKLPGEAWLEFSIIRKNGQLTLRQEATFRPVGLPGRLYWYSVLPFHYFVFNGMIRGIANFGIKRTRAELKTTLQAP